MKKKKPKWFIRGDIEYTTNTITFISFSREIVWVVEGETKIDTIMSIQ